MSVLVVGSTALDSIKTPQGDNPRLLGGSASHAAVAASFFSPTKLVGIVGEDFPKEYLALFRRHRIDLEGLEMVQGHTFHWSGEYEVNMNNRRTLKTELGVFETFSPNLPAEHRATPFVLLANIAPSLQHHVLDQMERPKFVIADTMDLWLNIALDDLLSLLKRIDALVLNDSEARQLTGQQNLVTSLKKIHRLGPKYVIIKKGEHGALVSSPRGLFVAPAFPLERVVDPTGAGDSFVGGLIGHLASSTGGIDKNLRQAVIHGTAVAAFCCEGFGITRTACTRKTEIKQRAAQIRKMSQF